MHQLIAKVSIAVAACLLMGLVGPSPHAKEQAAGKAEKPAAKGAAADAATPLAGNAAKQRTAPKQDPAPDPGQGLAALKSTNKAGKYLFVFFYKDGGKQTADMRKIFNSALGADSKKAERIEIDLNDALEKRMVEKYGVARAPMPLVLAVAPNGAITGGFPTTFTEKQLVEAFASPAMEKSLKALQERKLVFVCVQNAKTKTNEAAMQGVKDFKSDIRYFKATEIVTLDPHDAAEAKFLQKLQIDPKTKEAVTAFLAPPGVPIGKFSGATDKTKLEATLRSAASGACGPSGCGPSGCEPAK